MSDTGHVITLWRPRFIHRRKTCIKECQLTRPLSLAENDWAEVCPGQEMHPPVSKMSSIEYHITGEYYSKQCIAYIIELGQILFFTFLLFNIHEDNYETSFYMASSYLRQAGISLSQVTTQSNKDTILHQDNLTLTCVLQWIRAYFLQNIYTSLYIFSTICTVLYVQKSECFIISVTGSSMSPLFLIAAKLKRCSLIPFYLCLCQWRAFCLINQLQTETLNVIF